jgi:4a-hydroxytetrahydrobiopterin dehydratase
MSTDLLAKRCQACEGGIPALSADQIAALLPSVSGWSVSEDGKKLRRRWRARNFVAVLEFFQRVGALAEEEGHHPDLHLTRYREATIEISTHAVDALTENDFILAAKINQIPVELKT